MVELLVVVQAVVGSSPIAHPSSAKCLEESPLPERCTGAWPPATHMATIDVMVDVDSTNCDFDASAVIGPGVQGP